MQKAQWLDYAWPEIGVREETGTRSDPGIAAFGVGAGVEVQLDRRFYAGASATRYFSDDSDEMGGLDWGGRLFVILNLGGCFGQGGTAFSQQYLGASLEYRLHPTLKLQIAAEPVQSCLSQVGNTLVRQSRYQFGADLKWDREY